MKGLSLLPLSLMSYSGVFPVGCLKSLSALEHEIFGEAAFDEGPLLFPARE